MLKTKIAAVVAAASLLLSPFALAEKTVAITQIVEHPAPPRSRASSPASGRM